MAPYDNGGNASQGVWGSVAAAAGDIGGSIISNIAGARSARRQARWQASMAGTAHQREVNDLRAAGLNPILSATGGNGAATPTGTMFTPENPMRGVGKTIMDAVLAKQQIKNSNADIAQKEALTKNIDEQTKTQFTQQSLNSAAAFRERTAGGLNLALFSKAFADAQHSSAAAENLRVQKGLGLAEYMKKRQQYKGYTVPILGEIMGMFDYLQKFIPLAPSSSTITTIKGE